MSSEQGPKLYTNKPKKAQLKAKDLSSPTPTPPPTTTGTASSASAAAASYKMGSQSTAPPPPPPPPPQPPKESFARRYKFLWPLLLAVNFTVGAYLLMRTNKKNTDQEEEVSSNVPSTPVSSTPTTDPVYEKHIPSPTISEFVKLHEPIPENQQRELFKWMLEEKRKVKPKDSAEKKRIDEEKAILKQFIRAKSIPNI